MSDFITLTHDGILTPKRDLSLIPGDAPLLHEVMPPFFDFENAIDVANLLIDAQKRFGGIGLSANQVGLENRCFVAGVDDNIVAYFNPEITYKSEETALSEEGCLSFPGLYIKIRRPITINIMYQSYTGEYMVKQVTGLTARIIQHEVDHLNGITFIDRAGPMALSIAKKKLKRSQK